MENELPTWRENPVIHQTNQESVLYHKSIPGKKDQIENDE